MTLKLIYGLFLILNIGHLAGLRLFLVGSLGSSVGAGMAFAALLGPLISILIVNAILQSIFLSILYALSFQELHGLDKFLRLFLALFAGCLAYAVIPAAVMMSSIREYSVVVLCLISMAALYALICYYVWGRLVPHF
jgi:hypothetical protein